MPWERSGSAIFWRISKKIYLKREEECKKDRSSLKKYPNGFYTYAKSRINPRNGRGVSRYIGRYVRHPAILRRAVEWVNEAAIRLIPDRNFKMIRYYGLYARNKKRRVHKIMSKLRKYSMEKERHLKDRLRRLDAVICERCGSRMEMIEKWYPGWFPPKVDLSPQVLTNLFQHSVQPQCIALSLSGGNFRAPLTTHA